MGVELKRSPSINENTQKIIVPLAPESYLLGLMVSVQPENYMYYRQFFVMGMELIRGRF